MKTLSDPRVYTPFSSNPLVVAAERATKAGSALQQEDAGGTLLSRLRGTLEAGNDALIEQVLEEATSQSLRVTLTRALVTALEPADEAACIEELRAPICVRRWIDFLPFFLSVANALAACPSCPQAAAQIGEARGSAHNTRIRRLSVQGMSHAQPAVRGGTRVAVRDCLRTDAGPARRLRMVRLRRARRSLPTSEISARWGRNCCRPRLFRRATCRTRPRTSIFGTGYAHPA